MRIIFRRPVNWKLFFLIFKYNSEVGKYLGKNVVGCVRAVKVIFLAFSASHESSNVTSKSS